MGRFYNKKLSLLYVVGVVFGIMLINYLFSKSNYRIDITEEKIYSFSDATKKIINELPSPITIKFFFSESLEGVAIQTKNFGKAIKNVLKEYENIDPENITLEFIDTLPDSDEEEQAKQYGMLGADIALGERFYLGIVVENAKKEISTIPFLNERNNKSIEYDITKSIYDLYAKNDKKIGIMTDVNIAGVSYFPLQLQEATKTTPWVFFNEISKLFALQRVENDSEFIPLELNTVFVYHPKDIGIKTLYALDQFLLRGGNLIVIVDPYMRFDPVDFKSRKGDGGSNWSQSDLNFLLRHWGIEYAKSTIVGDINHPTLLRDGRPYPLAIAATKQNFNPDFAPLKGIETVNFVEPGGFRFKKKNELQYTSIIQTSTLTTSYPSSGLRRGNPGDIIQKLQKRSDQWQLAGIVQGQFDSAFEKPPALEKVTLTPFIKKSADHAKLLVITDADFLSDAASVRYVNYSNRRLPQPVNDNLIFMLNMFDALMGSSELMAIRTRGTVNRPLEVFEEKLHQARLQYNEIEQQLLSKLNSISSELSIIREAQAQNNKAELNPEQIKKLKTFQEDERKTQQELRKIRKLLRHDKENLENTLIGLNLSVLPSIVILFGICVYYRRSKNNKRRT